MSNLGRRGGPRIDLTGMRFGSLTVLSVSHRDRHRNYYWLCRCDCGTEKIIKADDFRYKQSTKSCGCLQLKITREDKIQKEGLLLAIGE